jgi:hypothetical protein
MENDNALRKVLRDLSISLSEDGEIRNIEFRNDDELGAINQNSQITINPRHAEILDAEDKVSGEQEFALIVNTESHEIEHDQVTDVEAMEAFAKEYEDSRPRLAGFIWNVIEDVYIDKRRTDRDRGLRPTLALQSELIRENQEPVTEMEPPYKHANAVLHIGKAGGTPVGFENVEDEDFKDYCAEIRALVDEARNTPIQSERTEIAHNIMDLMEEYAGNMDTPDLEMPNFMMVVPEEMMDDDGDPLPEPEENEGQEGEGQEGKGQEGEGQEGEGQEGEGQEGEGQEGEGQEGEGQEGEGQAGSGSGSSTKVGDPSDGSGGNTTPSCPKCGEDNPNANQKTVDGMVAARCYPPFSTDEEWVGTVEFVAHDDKDGVCGFRVDVNGSVPEEKINSYGYKVVETKRNTVEILEPKSNYDDKESIQEYHCTECGHDWIPSVGEL